MKYVEPKSHLVELFRQAVAQIAPGADLQVELDRPKQASHGDYACNAAMQLARGLKKNPREVASQLLQALPASELIDKTEIAGPGFINIFLKPGAKQALAAHILAEGERYGRGNAGKDRKVQVEFVSANPTGPLHVGHGRGAAVGDCLCRILAANGWQVTREFYYNDAGQQIDNLTRSVQLRCHGVTPDDPAWPEDGYRGHYIIDVANAYMAKENVNADDQHIVGKGDPDDAEAIRHFAVAYLRREQDLDLHAFGVRFDVFSLESALYTEGKVDETVRKLVASGHTYEQDDALWLRTTDFGDDKDRVMRKREGGYTYFVPDVAYHWDKWKRGFARVINEQGADHHSTITRVRAGLQALDVGIPQGWPEYVLHQMVTVLKNGEEVKISKRAGSYVTLRDLIDEVGCDATRYFLAARHPDSQLVFDIDLAKSQSNDNPVYYIQYAHARISRVLNEWGGQVDDLSNADLGRLEEQQELALLNRLAEFPEVCAAAARDMAPHLVAYYLKDLAADLHTLYVACRFLVDDEALKTARLALIAATRQTLRNGLALLGVSAPETM